MTIYKIPEPSNWCFQNAISVLPSVPSSPHLEKITVIYWVRLGTGGRRGGMSEALKTPQSIEDGLGSHDQMTGGVGVRGEGRLPGFTSPASGRTEVPFTAWTPLEEGRVMGEALEKARETVSLDWGC